MIDKEFTGFRRMTVLTPDSYMKKMIVVSTAWSFSEKEGQTAIAQASALNSFDIDFKTLRWEKLQKHTDFEDAIKFHESIVKEKSFCDCEEDRVI